MKTNKDKKMEKRRSIEKHLFLKIGDKTNKPKKR